MAKCCLLKRYFYSALFFIWEQMLVVKLPNCTNDGKIRYQLFLSGLAARHTFLMNTDNGKTWQIRSFTNKSGNEDSAWFLLDD